MYVNEWMSYECLNEGTYNYTFITYLLIHIHQKKKIAPEIATKIASVNGGALSVWAEIVY
jgi:hypothetical protein